MTERIKIALTKVTQELIDMDDKEFNEKLNSLKNTPISNLINEMKELDPEIGIAINENVWSLL